MLQQSINHYIRIFCFCFFAYSLDTFNHMVSTVTIYFENDCGTTHLHGDFPPVFAGIPPESLGIHPCLTGRKTSQLGINTT